MGLAYWRWPFFFFNDTATTEIYTLSLHDALPILPRGAAREPPAGGRGHDGDGLRSTQGGRPNRRPPPNDRRPARSEEHTSELQSRLHLVCRLLLEKKNRHRAECSDGDSAPGPGAA